MEGGREGTNSKGCAGKVASHFQRIIPFGTDFGYPDIRDGMERH